MGPDSTTGASATSRSATSRGTRPGAGATPTCSASTSPGPASPAPAGSPPTTRCSSRINQQPGVGAAEQQRRQTDRHPVPGEERLDRRHLGRLRDPVTDLGPRAALTSTCAAFPTHSLDTGQVPMILPAAKGGYGYDRTPGWNATWQAVPAWDSALFLIPWELYRYYGSTDLFAELYPMQDSCSATTRPCSRRRTTTRSPPRWVPTPAPRAPAATRSSACRCYIRFCDYMSSVGAMIGQTERAEPLRRQGSHPARGVRPEVLGPDGRTLHPGQHLQREHPRHRLEHGARRRPRPQTTRSTWPAPPPRQRSRSGWPSCSPTASWPPTTTSRTTCTARATSSASLDDYGYTDIALRAVTQTGAPGYVDQIARGATSLWESWTGGSLNHHYRGNVATWFYQALAGYPPHRTGIRVGPDPPPVPADGVGAGRGADIAGRA